MGRRTQPAIRARLLEACTDYALAHGLPDRLDPLARATGASTRMLIYHFGPRDALLRAQADEPYTATLQRAWTSVTGPDGQPYLRLFGRLREDADLKLWPDFRRTATTDWLGPLEDGLLSISHPELATLVLAVIRGLLMDLDATADTDRTDRAFRDFLGAVEVLIHQEH